MIDLIFLEQGSWPARVISLLKFRVACFRLYVLHLLNLKDLSVGLVSITDIVLIEGNLIEMIIKAQGCHEIVINGVKKLEGDCRRVIFKARNLDRPFNIFFYGCFRSITYTIWLKGYRVTLSNNTAAARVPDLSRMQKLPGKPIILRLTGTFALRSGQMKLSVFDSTRMKDLISK